jgi:hypothetical protein
MNSDDLIEAFKIIAILLVGGYALVAIFKILFL